MLFIELVFRWCYEIVAKGTIVSIDPKAKVHHMPLGRDCSKVWVESISDGKDEMTLYKITDEAIQ